jgi:long-chain fatty acid transport protein
LAAPAAWAGGFAQPDQNAWAMGAGGAFTARGSGAAALSYNVAGLAFAERPELTVGSVGRVSLARFTGEDPFPGTLAEEQMERSPRLIPTFDYAHPAGKRLVLGLGFHAPFDLASDWDVPSAFSGRYIAYSSRLTSHTLTPTIAIRLADRLAIGGGVDVHFTSFSVTRRVGIFNPFTQHRVDGGDLLIESDLVRSIGYRFGLVARPSQTLTLGISYRHSVTVDLEGTAIVERLDTGESQLDSRLSTLYPSGAVAFTAESVLPSLLTAGIALSHNDWTFSADVGLEGWASFGTLALDIEDTDVDLGPTTLLGQLEDTLQVRVGLERRVDHAWTVRGGYAYDPSPVPTTSLSPFLVDARRHCLTFGFSYSRGGWRIDMAPGVQLHATRATEGVSPEGYDGTYENAVPVLGLSIGRTF